MRTTADGADAETLLLYRLQLCIISQPYMFGYSSTIQERDLYTRILQTIQHMLINWFKENIIPNLKVNKERVGIDIRLIKAKFQWYRHAL